MYTEWHFDLDQILKAGLILAQLFTVVYWKFRYPCTWIPLDRSIAVHEQKTHEMKY